MKDNFSIQSHEYARYRPTYPQELYDFLLPLVPAYESAWDCGTGNGQVASKLAEYFDKVYATDISNNQIANAIIKQNIEYRIEPGSKSSFIDNQFDLITVGQAIHWFDLDRFYLEVKRTLKPGGLLAVIGYSLVRFNKEIDQILDHFYENTLGNYWDDARRLVEQHYRTLPFPFEVTKNFELEYKVMWSHDELVGYLSTWSALQDYLKSNVENPLPDVAESLKKYWNKEAQLSGSIPVFMRIARI